MEVVWLESSDLQRDTLNTADSADLQNSAQEECLWGATNCERMFQ